MKTFPSVNAPKGVTRTSKCTKVTILLHILSNLFLRGKLLTLPSKSDRSAQPHLLARKADLHLFCSHMSEEEYRLTWPINPPPLNVGCFRAISDVK